MRIMLAIHSLLRGTAAVTENNEIIIRSLSNLYIHTPLATEIGEDSAPLRFRSCEGEVGLLVDIYCCGELAPSTREYCKMACHCSANLNVRE